MSYADLTNLIGSYGFPIVACCALFWDRITNTRKQNEKMDVLTSTIQALNTAITDNSKIVAKLLDKLEGV